jgi:hypothetical protein
MGHEGNRDIDEFNLCSWNIWMVMRPHGRYGIGRFRAADNAGRSQGSVMEVYTRNMGILKDACILGYLLLLLLLMS